MSRWARSASFHLAAEAAKAFLASAAFFALAAVGFSLRHHLIFVLGLGAVYVSVLLVVAKRHGPLYGVPLAIAAGLAFDSFYIPPTRAFGSADWQNWLVIAIYLLLGVVIGALGARSQRRTESSDAARGLLAEQQAALRRVATLVARGERPDAVFAAVAEEVGVLLDVDGARVVRYLSGDEIMQLGGWTVPGHDMLPAGPLKLEGTSLAGEVLRTGGAVRIEDFQRVHRAVPSFVRQLGIRSGVAAPIVVEGHLWGAMLAWSLDPRELPEDAETRLAGFTELAATAISNSAAQGELARLADEQAALRRVATLIAGGAPPPDVFAAVAEELGRLLGVHATHILRFDPEGNSTSVGSWSTDSRHLSLGTRHNLDSTSLMGMVFMTGGPARVDGYDRVSDQVAAMAQRLGIRSSVGVPIVVEKQLWGVMVVSSDEPEPLAAGTESRIAGFTELVATAISNTASREELARLAEEQAALRRVATLVAREAPPEEVFAKVAEEVGQLLGVGSTHIARYEPGGTALGIGSWSADGSHVSTGTRVPLDGTSLTAKILETGRPTRIDDYEDASGTIAALVKELGVSSSVGTPIIVDGRPWGVMVASSKQPQALPVDAESRIAAFTELVATAISNTEARREVGRLAEEQAALRRVATLVARQAPPTEVFAKVAEEVGLLLGADTALMHRYEADGSTPVYAIWGEVATAFPVGTRVDTGDEGIPAQVRRTGRPVRIDDYKAAFDLLPAEFEKLGVPSAVGSPIVVDGRLWGVMGAATFGKGALPADAESRVAEFTELVATAISNMQARSDLAASRARIVAATDEERRRVVRDLHDGAQQRLVHTVVTLKLADRALENQGEGAPALVTEALQHAEEATAELRELAHGILPSVLTRGGLRAGVDALASRMPVPVEVAVSADRLPSEVEATAYFVVAEALTNVAKHSHAQHAAVTARVEDGTLEVRVRDDGVGGAQPDGSGLLGLGDRLAVLEGSLRVESPHQGGTVVAAAIPFR